MKRILLTPLLLLMTLPTLGETVMFSQDKQGALPAGWLAGVTGRGQPKWTIEADPTAPNGANVLKQSGSGDFPWCVKQDASITDGYVEVKFKPIAGRDDQAGGVVWRWKDGNQYYVASKRIGEQRLSVLHDRRTQAHDQVSGNTSRRPGLAHIARGIRRESYPGFPGRQTTD
jgi:hypothetical protein